MRWVEVTTFVPLYCPYVHLAIFADSGALYADQPRASSARLASLNLLANSDLRRPGYQGGSIMPALASVLHLRELEWLWRSGQLTQAPPLGWDLGRVFFASFWGQFGWMSLPLVGATPWEPALALVCAGGLLGVLVWLARPHGPQLGRQRIAVAVLLLMVLAGLLAPLLNAYTQPRAMALQQGRYLFPCMAPLVIALALGWRTLVPRAWRPVAAVVAGLFGLGLASAALNLVARAYA
jgi:hypothetical protein